MELTLFDQPLARRTDPITSHEAAYDMVESGKVGRHEAIILRAVRGNPGRTCGELAYCTPLGYEATHKRMKGMELKGLIVRGAIRKCTVRGTRMTTWYIKDGQTGQGCPMEVSNV